MNSVDFDGQPGCPYCGQAIAIHPRRLAFVFAGRIACEHLVWSEAGIGGSRDGLLRALVHRAAWIAEAPDGEDLSRFIGRFLNGRPGDRPRIHAAYTLRALRLSRPVRATGTVLYTSMKDRLLDSVRSSLALAAVPTSPQRRANGARAA
jgi:hypothetical protein